MPRRWYHIKKTAHVSKRWFSPQVVLQKGVGVGRGVVSLSDRWSSNRSQDFIKSVASVKGYSCERLPPPGAWQAGQKKSCPLVALQGHRMPLTQNPGYGGAEQSGATECFQWAELVWSWGLAGKASSWNTRRTVSVILCVCEGMFAFVLVAPLCARPVAVTHFTNPHPNQAPFPFAPRPHIHQRLRKHLTKKKNPCGGDNAMQCNGQPLK